jgi:hypothetical protein
MGRRQEAGGSDRAVTSTSTTRFVCLLVVSFLSLGAVPRRQVNREGGGKREDPQDPPIGRSACSCKH